MTGQTAKMLAIVFLGLLTTIACGLPARVALAHGDPVIVSTSGGKLTTDKHFYFNGDPEFGFSSANFPTATTVPGFDILGSPGIQSTDNMGFNVVSKLLFSDGGPATFAQEELLEILKEFELGPGGEVLGVSVMGNSPAFQAGVSFRDAGLFLNQHSHYLSYELTPNNVKTGAYGVFLTITDPGVPLQDSQQFLLIFNRGLDDLTFATARDQLYPTQWAGPSGGAYNAVANWSSTLPVTVVPNGTDSVARFLGNIDADSTVTIDAPATVGSLQFDNAHRYTIAGPSTLTLGSSTTASIKLSTGDHTISAPLAIASNTNIVAGAQTLTLSGAPSWSANKSLTVASGTLEFNTASAASSVGAGAKLVVAAGSTVNVSGAGNPFAAGASRVSVSNDSASGLNIIAGNKDVGAITGLGKTTIAADAQLTTDSIRQSALAVHGSAGHASGRLTVRTGAGPASVSMLNSLQLDATPAPPDNNPATPENVYFGGLDLARNKLIVDYSGATPLAAIRDALQAGNGPGHDWSSAVGITTSLGDSSALSLGYAEANALFDSFPAQFAGEQIDDTAILIAFARYGDTNLSGAVDFTDLNSLLTNYGLAGVWSQGDFDFNGKTDFTDLNMLLTNYGQAVATLAPAQAVPEPGSLLLALVAALAAVGSWRRRRRNQTIG